MNEVFASDELKKQGWEKAQLKYEDKLQFWVGKGPLKNHIRVLLCTL